MKPSAFEYFAPHSLAEAINLLQRCGEEAKILAGGQSLVPLMNFRAARPRFLVDINRIQELETLMEEGGELVIGALTRERFLEVSPLVREKCPLLAEAISYIGHVPIRVRGTAGGSLAHADPSAEIPLVFSALGGRVKVAGPAGERVLSAPEFFVTYLTSALEPSEVLVEARLPIPPAGSGWSFQELSRRQGDFAIVAVACVLLPGGNGLCREAKIALGGVAPTPRKAAEAERLLSGRKITPALIREAALQAARSAEPDSDYHATADYRREMARVFTERALKEAWSRSGGGN